MADLNKNLKRETPNSMTWIVPPSLTATLHGNAFYERAAGLAKLGWDVTLIAQGRRGRDTQRGFHIEFVPMPRIYFFGQAIYHFFASVVLLGRWKATDVIYFHQESALWLCPLRLVSLISGGNTPILVMDTRTVPMIADTVRAKLRAVYRNMMGRFANFWVDGQTAITRRMADAVGIPPSQLLGIWPSGANSELFGQARAGRRWPKSGETVPIVYVGALYKERNVMTFCRAVVKAAEQGMDFSLTIVGSGDERPELEAYAAGSAGRVRVLPPVPHGEVPNVLRDACLGVLPFPDEEKFRVSSPIKLFEYMAAGMPILATRIVCHTDVVGDAPFAFWAETSDEAGLLGALQSCWEARDRMQELGDLAAVAAEGWTWDASVKKLSDALITGLGRRQARE